jgi:probable F420-dependent oxidoreductase
VTPRPFRFGVITSHAPDGPAWRSRACRAEALGYSSLLMPDHFQDQWEPAVGMTVAAEATERLNVGTLVFDNDYRHPVMLAKSIATLDLASGGRVEFGLGAGWKRSDYDESGMPYDPPGVRIDRMAESLAIMRALWASADPVHFTGRHYTITGAVGTPRPHSRPAPKICIGGGGKRMLSFAAREADIVAVNATMKAGALDASVAATANPAAYDEKIAWVRDAATTAGRVDAIELQCHCPFVNVSDDQKSMLEALAPAFGCSPADAIDIPFAMVGTIAEMCEAVVRRRDRWGFTYTIVPDDAMEAFAPVVAELSGRS